MPGVEEQPPAGSLVVVEHDAPVAHALQVAADLLRLAVLFPRHELQLHGLVYPVVELHQASSTLDVSLSYRTPYATMRTARLGAYSGDPGSIGAGQSEAKAKGRAKGGVQKRLSWVTTLLYPTASERGEGMLALCSSGYSQRWRW